jgi:hypothetical protein
MMNHHNGRVEEEEEHAYFGRSDTRQCRWSGRVCELEGPLLRTVPTKAVSLTERQLQRRLEPVPLRLWAETAS